MTPRAKACTTPAWNAPSLRQASAAEARCAAASSAASTNGHTARRASRDAPGADGAEAGARLTNAIMATTIVPARRSVPPRLRVTRDTAETSAGESSAASAKRSSERSPVPTRRAIASPGRTPVTSSASGNTTPTGSCAANGWIASHASSGAPTTTARRAWSVTARLV